MYFYHVRALTLKQSRGHNILQPNLYVRVFPNGDVLYSIRVSLTCACSMHLALFPLDKQTCNLDVASCKYQTVFFWQFQPILTVFNAYTNKNLDCFTIFH